MTTCIHVPFPLHQIITFFLRTASQSTAPTRSFSSANPTQQQYWHAQLRTGIFRRAPCGNSRWSILPDRQIALQIRAAFLAQRGSRSSLRHAGTEDSPYLSLEEMMRRRHGSTRGYAPSYDLEPGVRCSGATDRRTAGAATRVLQPPFHLSSQFRRLRALPNSSDRSETRHEYRARVVRCAHSESERGVTWIALNNPKTTLVDSKPLTARADISDSHK